MSKKDQDKIKSQTEHKSPEISEPVLDEQDNSQETEPPEDPHKKSKKDPLDAAPDAPGNPDKDQPVAETPPEASDTDDGLSADAESDTGSAAEGKDKDEVSGSENNSADQGTQATPEPEQTDDNAEPADPEHQDQNDAKADKSVDDGLSADAESDTGSAAEEEAKGKDEVSESEDSPADEDPNKTQESSLTGDEQGLDTEAKDPNASSSTKSVDGDLSTDKESDASAENEADKGEDDSLTDAESDDSSEPNAAQPSVENEAQDAADEKQSGTLDDITGEDQGEQTPNDTEEGTEDLPELKSKRRIPLVKAVLAIITLAAVFAGFFIFDNKSNLKSTQKTESKEMPKAFSAKASQKKTKPTIQPDDPNYFYYAKIGEISSLREILLQKKEEILQLKKHYQAGIEELEKEILDELRHPATVTFLQVIENKRIEFGLRTIQRRLAYIRQLDRPADWVFQAAEDLLYIKRKALMDIQVAEVASGIDMNMHLRHMNTALNKYRPTADKLATDMTDAQSESLEVIWQRIQNKSLAHSSQLAHSKNQIISEQICTGDFSRLAELSEISVDSAKCVIEMQSSDLFLNGLTEISPRAARHLFQWKGNWMCLNGFRALSPRVAAYLFEWEGTWISLNGLTDFPPEIGRILLQWGGSQLELMGLRPIDGSSGKIGIKYLAQWERSGGKLFVPKTIRKKIDKLNGSQRPSA